MTDRREPLDTLDEADMAALREAATARRRPLVADVPKRLRTRLAKAELWAMLAAWCEVVADDVPNRVGDPDDGLHDLCQRYGLGAADVARLLHAMGSELQNTATNRGLPEAWR